MFEALYNAEGISAEKNEKLNNYLTSKKVLEVQNALAQNEKLVVTGISGGRAANMMLKANIALKDSNIQNIPETSRTSMLSEIALAKGQSDIQFHVISGEASPSHK